MKLLVITERGRVVGTQPITFAADAPASAVLRAGPGQKADVVDVAVPGDLTTARKIDEFHRLVARALRPAKAKRAKKKR